MITVKAIDRLFERLQTTYGEEWDRKWGKTPLGDVKTLWAEELAPYGTKSGLEAIAWALMNLPERAPNIIQFKALCRSAPRSEPVALLKNEAKPDPQRLKAELEKLGGVKDKVLQTAYNPRQWAIDLQARIDAGYRPTIAQRQIVREALNQG